MVCVAPNKANSDFPLLLSLDMDDSSETNVSYSRVLEFAADNDVEGFKECIKSNPNAVDEVGLWYGRQVGAKGMVLEYRTPLMVAAMYGSIDVMKVILSLSKADVNGSFGADKSTALHCAASGGSVEAVKLLLVSGGDVNLCDENGRRPYDVITVLPNQKKQRAALEDALCYSRDNDQKDLGVLVNGLKLTPLTIPTLSESKPSELENNDTNNPVVSEKKEYPFDPTLPDIKNSMYSTDEFRMYSFKIRPCSRAYSHDWTECPFVHPGENARRRDPSKYNYSCVPCPEFRKGSCRRGDMCEYAHGVFECWLHPAQYRTRLCKDGTSCNRRVCFFAHLPEEVRPMYPSTGSAVPSPRSMTSAAAVMDMAAALNMFPGSPSVASAMSPNPFTPPLSPNSSLGWNQHSIPTLNLPGNNIQASNLQASRLRSSLNARDVQFDDFMLQDLDLGQHQILNNMASNSQPQFGSPSSWSNLDERFSSEMSSPRYSDPLGGTTPMFSPSHKSAMMMNNFQMQQRMLSPINTKAFSPKSIDHPLMQQHSFGPSSPRMMSPRGMDPLSPLNARLAALALRERHNQIRSLSARDLSANLPRDLIPENGGMSGSPVEPWSNWESSNGRPDWSVNGDELNRLKRSSSMGHNGEEPDLSWVQSLVKDPPFDNNAVSGSNQYKVSSNSNSGGEPSSLTAWLDQMGSQ